jgi:hypothetical protein
MKYNLAMFPVSEDDEQLKDDKGRLATFRETLMKGMTTDVNGDNPQIPINTEEKFKRWEMWRKFKVATTEVELTPEEVTFVTKVCGIAFPVLVAGQCREFLRNPEK